MQSDKQVKEEEKFQPSDGYAFDHAVDNWLTTSSMMQRFDLCEGKKRKGNVISLRLGVSTIVTNMKREMKRCREAELGVFA